MANNDAWSWDKHKYKSKEWVKGSWKYVYDTAKKTTDKVKKTVEDVSSKTSNTLKETRDKSKDYISNKFDKSKEIVNDISTKSEKYVDDKFKSVKDKAEQLINGKTVKDSSIGATYYKENTAHWGDVSVAFKYRYTDLITDILKENPIPTSIGLGLSLLAGTTIPSLIGIGITDLIINHYNNKNRETATAKATQEAKNEQTRIEIEKKNGTYDINKQIDEKIDNLKTAEDFNNLTDEEKERFKKTKPFEYSVWVAKCDDRPSMAVEMSDDEKDKRTAENNPGFWQAIIDNNFKVSDDNYNLYDENCFACTLAYTEQRKGNNVYPDDEMDDNGIPYELYPDDVEALYDDAKVIDFGYNNNARNINGDLYLDHPYTDKDINNIIDTMQFAYPEGSFGNMSVQWFPEGGHSLF